MLKIGFGSCAQGPSSERGWSKRTRTPSSLPLWARSPRSRRKTPSATFCTSAAPDGTKKGGEAEKALIVKAIKRAREWAAARLDQCTATLVENKQREQRLKVLEDVAMLVDMKLFPMLLLRPHEHAACRARAAL